MFIDELQNVSTCVVLGLSPSLTYFTLILYFLYKINIRIKKKHYIKIYSEKEFFWAHTISSPNFPHTIFFCLKTGRVEKRRKWKNNFLKIWRNDNLYHIQVNTACKTLPVTITNKWVITRMTLEELQFRYRMTQHAYSWTLH